MEWKDGNCWYRNYFDNCCFNKQFFLKEIKFIFLIIVLKDLIKITLVKLINLIKKYCIYWTSDTIIDLIKIMIILLYIIFYDA